MVGSLLRGRSCGAAGCSMAPAFNCLATATARKWFTSMPCREASSFARVNRSSGSSIVVLMGCSLDSSAQAVNWADETWVCPLAEHGDCSLLDFPQQLFQSCSDVALQFQRFPDELGWVFFRRFFGQMRLVSSRGQVEIVLRNRAEF